MKSIFVLELVSGKLATSHFNTKGLTGRPAFRKFNMFPSLSKRILIFARKILAIAIAVGTLCSHCVAFAQTGSSTTLHDFNGIGNLSALRAEKARFELVDGGNAERGQALRVSFESVPEQQNVSQGLVFEKSSMPHRDFSQIESLSFWVKNESYSSTYISISAQDQNGKRSSTSPDRVYISVGPWRRIVYRLDLQGLDRENIGSLHFSHKSKGQPLTLLFDDIELLSPLASQLVSLEDQIRNRFDAVEESTKQTGLEALIEADKERLKERFNDLLSLDDSERLPLLSQLVQEVEQLLTPVRFGPDFLSLRGKQVTDAWLAASAPKLTDIKNLYLYDTSITDAGLTYLHPLEHLELLVIQSRGVTGPGLKGLSPTRLSILDLRGSGITDAGLESIEDHHQLQSINLDHTSVTNAGLRHLAQLKRLKILSFRGTAIADEGLSHLQTLTDLERLDLGSTGITTLADLSELENLKHLDLSETPVDDAGLTGLRAFPKLASLNLSNTDILGPGLTALKGAMQLSVLKLNGTRINDAALDKLVALPKLTRLEISSTRITDATLVRIARAKGLFYGPHLAGHDTGVAHLSYLDIYGTNVSGDGIRQLGALTKLRELYAGGTGADDASITALSGLGDLFHLDLQGTRITDASLEPIGKFKNLNSLNLSGTAVTGSNISNLSGIEELRTLNLAGTRASNEALQSIARDLVRAVNPDDGSGGGFAWLNNLILTDTEVSDTGLENISRLKHLFELHLGGTNIGDESLAQIALLPNLQSLWLDGTDVSDDGLAVLSNSHKLRTLSLKRTKVTDDALRGLGAPILELALSHTHIKDGGVQTLATKEGLQLLELASTAITDSALKSIAHLPNLRVLDLGATPISDQGVTILKTMPALSELRLDHTTITDLTAELLARFVSLDKVSLEGTRVTADGKALLERRRPALDVKLAFPRTDTTWADDESSYETQWSSSALPEEATVTDLEPLSAVRSLSFQHRTVRADTLVAIHDIANLEALDLADTNVDDDLLANLSGLSQLRALRLSRTAISDDGLQHLAGLLALEHLDLAETRVTGTGLQHLKGLTALRSIRLSETFLRDEHAADLGAIKSLRKISASNTRLGDTGLRELERLSALRYLDLFGTDVSNVGLESIGRMRSLSHLYLSETAATDLGLATLVGLEELVELGIDGCEITDRGLAFITGFRHLDRLRLNRTHISDDGVNTISEISSLRKLELSDTAISDRSAGSLLKLTALEELDLDGTALGDRGLGELGSLENLERLSIRDTKVSPAGIEMFKATRPEVLLTFESEPSEFSWIGIALTLLYGLIALTICFYGAHRYLLVWLFVRDRDIRIAQALGRKFSELPRVTIQIPLFNESNVAERIITAACAMDYPRDRLQIQVLDDSTDDCTEIVRECCVRFQTEGIDIAFHHRDTREGFKSGALAAGLETATGEFVAIFDADFVPAPDFLRRTVHHFTDESVGVVQAAWRHLNRNESLLTRCQAMFLDGHLVVEQATRAWTGRWFNFNGTAGLWRRSCIDKSGGWRNDTLTEDTDLSYRAQLDGWRFVYLPNVQADAELPSTMSAFLSQQHRWTRGLLQCAVKLMPRIILSKAPSPVKVEAWVHLTAPILYVAVFLLTALAIPATFVALPLSQLRGAPAWALGSAVLFGGTLAAAIFVMTAQRAAGQSLVGTLIRLPALMALGVGMSAVNTHAALGALLGVRSPFVRTPKFGDRSDSETDPDARRGLYSPPVGAMELLISGLLSACLVLGLSNDFSLIGAPFLFLFAAGFLWVGGARFVESGRRVTVSRAIPFRGLRWSAATAFMTATVVIILGAGSILKAPPETARASRVAGLDLTSAEWNVRGSSVVGTEARLGGLALDVDLDPELKWESDSQPREEGEIFIDLTGPLASLGTSLSDSQELFFDIAYPRNFSGELQAFVSDAEGKSQYGTIAFVERHDARRRVRVGIAPGSLTPPMGYTDPDFDAQRPIRRAGLKVSAQSDRVRGRGYRPFHGELTVENVGTVSRNGSRLPEIRTIPVDQIHRPEPTSQENFLASSGADRPWPLGYAFSGPLSVEQGKTLDRTYGALHEHGLGFTRVYLGDYRTGLVFDATGSVTSIEPQFLDFLDELAETANRHGVTVMFSLMDNTLLDGKGIEFPQFVVDRKESDRFIARVLAPIIERLAERQVIWDLFNEPENVIGAELSTVQDFVNRALAVLRKSSPNAKFTVVSRSASELVYWRGRGLDVLSHNVFDPLGLTSAKALAETTLLDAPVMIAEMDPALASVDTLETLRRAGYRGVGLWGWETGDKYDWNANELDRIISPLVQAKAPTDRFGK